MTAIVILNVIGAALIVSALFSLLAWAIVSDHRMQLVGLVRPASSTRAARRTSRRQPTRPALHVS